MLKTMDKSIFYFGGRTRLPKFKFLGKIFHGLTRLFSFFCFFFVLFFVCLFVCFVLFFLQMQIKKIKTV